MKYVKIFSSVVNAEQVTHIKFNIPGSKCGADYEHRNIEFTVITLACGSRIRINNRDKDLPDILEQLGVPF